MHPDVAPLRGLAIERTALAWQRSSLSLVSVGVLVVRWSTVEHFPLWPGIVLTALAAIGSLVVVGLRYRGMREHVHAGQTPRSRYLVPVTAGLTVAVVIGVGAGIVVQYTTL